MKPTDIIQAPVEALLRPFTPAREPHTHTGRCTSWPTTTHPTPSSPARQPGTRPLQSRPRPWPSASPTPPCRSTSASAAVSPRACGRAPCRPRRSRPVVAPARTGSTPSPRTPRRGATFPHLLLLPTGAGRTSRRRGRMSSRLGAGSRCALPGREYGVRVCARARVGFRVSGSRLRLCRLRGEEPTRVSCWTFIVVKGWGGGGNIQERKV